MLDMTQVTLTNETFKKFGKLADLLEQAGKLARELSHAKGTATISSVPTLTPPKDVPEDEEWFWSDQWQKGEHEVNYLLAKGEYEVFESADDLINDLHSHL